MKITKLVITVIALVLAIVITGCSSKDNIIIGVLPDMDSIPIVTAYEEGLLPQKVVLMTFKSSIERDAALLSGRIDGCVSDMLSLILLKQAGADVKAAFTTSGSYSLLASKNSGITSELDILGKDVAISRGTVIEYTYRKFGFGKELSVPSMATRKQLLDSNSIDAAILPEPFALSSVEMGAKVIMKTDNEGIGLLVINCEDGSIDTEICSQFFSAYNTAVEMLSTGSNLQEKAFEFLGLPSIKEELHFNYAKKPSELIFAQVLQYLKDTGDVKKNLTFDLISFNE